MMLLIFSAGFALLGLSVFVSSRMTTKTRAVDRIGAMLAGSTGAVLMLACTIKPDWLWPALWALIACAAWFAIAPPRELAEAKPSAIPAE